MRPYQTFKPSNVQLAYLRRYTSRLVDTYLLQVLVVIEVQRNL
jgi:hypothetical protein